MLEILLYAAVIYSVVFRYYLRKDKIRRLSTIEYDYYDKILSGRMGYYDQLSPSGKQNFIARVDCVYKKLDIQGRDEFIVNDEVRTLICASICQLTYGFKEPHLPFLQGVLVYPDIFYSRLARNWVKGLAMSNGVVFLSWRDFKEGYLHATDTYNLGLHEFAHILKMQTKELFLSDKKTYAHFEQWAQVAYPVFSNTRGNNEDFFRAYAGTNDSEFFSVCIENFFEIPESFEAEMPQLYYHLCHLLHQNPLNVKGDYSWTIDDVILHNEKLSEEIPIDITYISNKEFRFWVIVTEFIHFVYIIDVLIFTSSVIDTQLAIIRMLVVSAVIIVLARLSHFKNLQETFHQSFVKYLFMRLLPVLFIVISIIAALSDH